MNRKVYIVTKKKKKRRKLAFIIMVPILLLFLAASAYAVSLYLKAESVADSSFESLDGSSKELAEVSNSVENMSVLFIGVDDSENRNFGDSTRSDALILATFNKKDKSVKLLSIPRDSYVYVPEKDRNTKINHAYAYGGARTTVETVEELMGFDIDYYVRMNFYAFIDIVDALGGIEVDVPYELREKDSTDKNDAIYLKEGLQTVDGEEALAFARTRHMDNDIERGKRQQQVMEAVIDKAASISSFTKFADLIDAIGNNMKTNLTFSQMKSLLAFAVTNTNELTTETLQLQGEDGYIDDVYYFILDEEALEETKESMEAHLNGISNTSADLAQEDQSLNEDDSDDL